MLNYSAIETKIEMEFSKGDILLLNASDFAFESDPLSIQSMPVSRMELDLNGHPVNMRSRQPINLTLSLVPGSSGDQALQKTLYAKRCGDDVRLHHMRIKYPTMTAIVFLDGILSAGIPGVGLSAEGKLRNGGVYNLTFAEYRYMGIASVNSYTDNKFQTEGESEKQPIGDKSKKTNTNKPKKVITGKWGWGIQF